MMKSTWNVGQIFWNIPTSQILCTLRIYYQYSIHINETLKELGNDSSKVPLNFFYEIQ